MYTCGYVYAYVRACAFVYACICVCVFASVHVNFHVIDYYMTDSGHSSFNHVMYTVFIRIKAGLI